MISPKAHLLAEAAVNIHEALEKGHAAELATFILLGRASLLHNDPTSALKWWRKALKEDNNCVEALIGAGVSHHRLGEFKDATAQLEQALELEPDNVSALVASAVAHLEVALPAHAIELANKVLSIEPEHLEGLLLRAKSNVALARFDDAVPDLGILNKSNYKLGEQGLLEAEISFARGDFEAGLVVAASLCENYPNANEPLRIFREGFERFLGSDDRARFIEFVDGLGLELQPTRVRSDTADQQDDNQHDVQIDVIVPIHNGLDATQKCLRSLEAAATARLGRVILIDDASDEPTRRWLEEEFKDSDGYRLIRNDRPQGFTKCVAAGTQLSSASRFVALNSDAVLPKHWLSKLSDALDCRPNAFLASPMSNCAGWQNVGPVLSPNGNFAVEAVPDALTTSELDLELESISQFTQPVIPFVHGFCVIVDRKAYDTLGGLDIESFPLGYGEFQDLALRGLDRGYKAVVADNCFVGHVGSASIENKERSVRSRAARAELYGKHSALKYLSAECLCIFSPQLGLLRKTFYALRSGRFGPASFLGQEAEFCFVTPTRIPLKEKKVCIFVAYAPDGRLLPYTETYIAALADRGFEVILVLNTEDMTAVPKLDSAARIVALRQNIGFDFGAWRDVCQRLPEVWESDLLLFVNDSLIGPFGNLEAIAGRIDACDADLFYLTDSMDTTHHFQSFFWGLKGAGLKNALFRDFIESIRNMTSKEACILLYELSLRTIAVDFADMKPYALFPISELSHCPDATLQTINPTHHHWLDLLERGFAFIKADFCRQNINGKTVKRILRAIESHGGDPLRVRSHVEASAKARFQGSE